MELWQFFSLMLVGWFISYQLSLLDPNRKRSIGMAKLFRFLIGLCWLLALIFAIYPKIAHASGPYVDWQDGAVYSVPGLKSVYNTSPPRDGYRYYIHTLTEEAVEIPIKMSGGTNRVWAECEVQGRWFTLYGHPEEAVGLAGELGQAQIHPIHFPRMRSMGLDPYQEGDRIRFAVILWEERQWQHWSCGKGVE